MTIDVELQRRAARLVEREVLVCMSSLIDTLSVADYEHGADKLGELMDQACHLADYVLDYESAARECGWTVTPQGWLWRNPTEEELEDGSADFYFLGSGPFVRAESAEAACELDDIGPEEHEVFEHWAVSDWLADKLEAKGERVDRDFSGLIVWARTTTGQAISIDSVIEEITRETGYASHDPQAQAAPPITLDEAEQRATAANQALADKLEAFAADRLRAIQAERPKASVSFASAMGTWSFYIDRLVVDDHATDELFSRVLQDFGWVCIPAPVALSFEGGALVRKTEW